MSPEELRARIAQLEETERKQAAALLFTRKDLQMCRDHLRLLQPASERTIVRTKMDIDTAGLSSRARMGAGRSKREHIALGAFYRHDKTVTAIAEELGETRPRVDSWMRTKDVRPIRSRCRIYLRVKYGIPDAAWAKSTPAEPGDAEWLKKRGIPASEK